MQIAPTFDKLPIFWKILIIIGLISTFIFMILLCVIISLFMESKKIDKPELDDYDDFLDEFQLGKKPIIDDYPQLPLVKDLKGNLLKNLLQITVL